MTNTMTKDAAVALAARIKTIAARREREGNYDTDKSQYIESLHDMAYEDELSYPVYLLLTCAWNDALAWVKNPARYVGGGSDTRHKTTSVIIDNKTLSDIEFEALKEALIMAYETPYSPESDEEEKLVNAGVELLGIIIGSK